MPARSPPFADGEANRSRSRTVGRPVNRRCHARCGCAGARCPGGRAAMGRPFGERPARSPAPAGPLRGLFRPAFPAPARPDRFGQSAEIAIIPPSFPPIGRAPDTEQCMLRVITHAFTWPPRPQIRLATSRLRPASSSASRLSVSSRSARPAPPQAACTSS
ncbi:protein of unknown function [Burkholderia multivorans]